MFLKRTRAEHIAKVDELVASKKVEDIVKNRKVKAGRIHLWVAGTFASKLME